MRQCGSYPVCRATAHEVNPASLLAGTQQFGDSGSDTFMRIGDHQLDPAQAPAGQLSYERGPESLSFRRADIHADNFALAVGVDTHRNDHGHRHDPAGLPDFDVRGVDPQIRPVALDGAVEERVDALVDLLTQPRDLAL